MPATVIDPRTCSQWDALVSSAPGATPYHTSAWARALAECYHYQPRYLILEDAARRAYAGLPLFLVRSCLTGRRLTSLPFADTCSPLGQTEADRCELLVAARELASAERASYVEVRGLASEEQAVACGFVPVAHSVLHRLQLAGRTSDDLLAAMSRSSRSNVRRGVRESIPIEDDSSSAGIRRYYAVHLRTRSRQGVPPQPLKWFDALYRQFGDSVVKVLIATHENRDVAGAILLAYDDTVYYKYAAADRLPDLQGAPRAILWRAICWALDAGYSGFDFGRTDPRNEGLVQFKRSWGGDELPLLYAYHPAVRGLASGGTYGSRARMASAVVSRLPLPVLRLMGSLVYRHLA